MDVHNPKAKKPILGYYKKAIRNDTNFKFTRFLEKDDTLIRTTVTINQVSQKTDSIISIFICRGRGFLFLKNTEYVDGNIIREEYPNVLDGN